MIDTDEYTGHIKGPWRIVCWERQWYIEGNYEEGQEDCTASGVCQVYGTAQRKDPTTKLIADAPKLLAEVKRLRKTLACIAFSPDDPKWVGEKLDDLAVDSDTWIRWME